MGWDATINRYSKALLRIISALFVLMASSRLGASGLTVPRHVWRSILGVLRPAEAAARRLIIIAARTLVCAAPKLRQRSFDASRPSADLSSSAFSVAPVFQLFDPLKRFDFNSEDDGRFSEGSARHSANHGAGDFDNTPVDATCLHNRLRALRLALCDLPRQAARLARFYGRRDAVLAAGKPIRVSLMRPGRPPGWCARGRHEIYPVLKDCHDLARHFENMQFENKQCNIDTS